MQEPLEVTGFSLGMWQTNCYVVAAGRSAWVIDAGFDPGELIEFVNRKQLVVERVLLTHAHLDHIAGLPELRAAWPDVKTYIHPNEKRFFADPMLNLSGLFGIPITVPDADATFQQGDPLTLGGHEFHILGCHDFHNFLRAPAPLCAKTISNKRKRSIPLTWDTCVPVPARR